MAVAMVGAAGLALIQNSEGLRTKTYIDPVGIPTVCYGHTGPDVAIGQVYSPSQCRAILMVDVAKHQQVLLPSSPKNCIWHIPLNQNQLDALTSFTFNVGEGNFCKSTMALRLRYKDYRGAALEFPKWTNGRVNGKLVKLSGLIKRRTAEKRLFEAPSPPAVPNAPTDNLRAILTPSK